MSFSKYIKDIRSEKGLSQTDLAKILKISPTSIKNIESSRTKYPKYQLFFNLRNYLKESDFTVAKGILFNDEVNDYGVNVNSLIKDYLTYVWAAQRPIDINVPYKTISGNSENFIAYFWKAGLPYYKVIIADYNREKFKKAIQSNNPNALFNCIMEETRFYNFIDNTNSLKEIRFVLDKNNKDDCYIMDNIKELEKLSNLGKLADVSFVLFDPIKYKYDTKDKVYITNRLSHINI